MYACAYIDICTHGRIYTCVSICTDLQISRYRYIYICMYIYTHAYTYMHIYVYTDVSIHRGMQGCISHNAP